MHGEKFFGNLVFGEVVLAAGLQGSSPWAALSTLLSLEQEAKTSGGKESTAR